MSARPSLLKRAAARLPESVQDNIKRLLFYRQIRSGRFIAAEPEMAFIKETVRPGDWTLDVGANVGHYTAQLSECVGPSGRVIAFEPIPATMALLASNVEAFPTRNVTLINAAASDHMGTAAMILPKFDTGLVNYYRAAIAPTGDYSVLTLPIDSLQLPRVSLIKVDAEGHDLAVLRGAQALIERDRPALIVECELESEVSDWLRARGYQLTRLKGSPNVIATHREEGFMCRCGERHVLGDGHVCRPKPDRR